MGKRYQFTNLHNLYIQFSKELEQTHHTNGYRATIISSYQKNVSFQVWSITYNNWLTFALLVWSCIIWMMRDRRRYAMMSAPFLAIYGTVLVVLGFLSGLRLSREELFPGLPLTVIVDFDLNSYHPAPCIHLGAKVKAGSIISKKNVENCYYVIKSPQTFK